jgi:hypothetical protein
VSCTVDPCRPDHGRDRQQADAELTRFGQDGRLPRMPLERRLVPINAFIGLCDPSPPWPSTLADAGFQLAALEVPVVTEAGTVTLDGDMRQAIALAQETIDRLGGGEELRPYRCFWLYLAGFWWRSLRMRPATRSTPSWP